MKNKHCITLLFASLLSTAGAVAASWTPPTVTGQELKTGETQYAYNVKANGFLNANSGKTTIVADEGLPLFITSSTNDTYLMGTTEDEGLTYTYVYYEDNQISKTGGEAGRTHLNWSIVAQGDGTYYIRPDRNDENYGEDYFPEMWMGWKNDGTDIIYPLIDGYEETYGITWKFVNETEYFHFVNLKALSDAMTKAQEYGFDITAALAVYNNTASTNEELAAATTELKTKIREYEIEHATNDHPVDLSDVLVNHDFEDDFVASGTEITGWTQEPAGAFTYDYSDVNGGWTNIGRWAGGDSRFTDAKIHQIVNDAPNGKYELKVYYTCIDQEPGNPESDGKDENDYSVTGNTLYAVTSLGTSEVNLSSNDRWGVAQATLTFFITDGKLEVGVEMLNSTANWFRLGDIQLTYYGKDAIKDELQTIVDKAKTINSGMNQTYRDNLDKVIAEAEGFISEGASVPDMTAKAEELNAVMDAAMENVEAYATLERTYEIGDSILNVLEGKVNDDIEALAAYMDEIDITTILATYPYTTPELGEIIDKLDLLTQSAQHSLITEGTDVTEFITNPSFADGLNGWTVEGDATKIVTENDLIAMDGIVCDVSQTLLGMPNGVYELTLQGFQRTDWNFESMDETWTTQKGQDSLRNQVHSYIYLNEGVQAVKHSFDDGINEDFTVETVGTDNWDIRYGTKSGVMMPNTTNGAKQYFEKGYYKNTIQAFVIDGKLTFGIRNEGDQGARWGCIDNITLRYVGTDLEKAIALLQEKLEDVAPYLDEKMNGDIKTKMSEGYTKGQELVNNPDADFDEVIDVIAALTQSLEGVDESIEAFKKLAHANEVAAKDLAYEGVAATESGQQLQALYDTNNAGYQNESADLTVEKIDEVAEQYLELALKAKIEKGIKANDDLTYILTNPSFEDQWGLGEGVNGVYNAPFGWTFMVDSIVCTKAEDMNAAGLNNFTSPDKNVDCTDGEYGYCLQTGDFPDVYMYQEIEGLPAGYYKVTVDMVVPNNNYDYRLAGQRLYVNDAAMYYGYEEEYDLDLLETGHPYEVERTFGEYDEVTIEENGELGDKGPLNTLEVVVHVAANEPLKLGVRTDGHWEYTYKRTEAPEGWNNCGWCKFDNVRLSCVSIDSGESIDETVATGKVKSQEVYSIDGIKLPGLQKGVNILRQTLEDGTVVTKKVIVK